MVPIKLKSNLFSFVHQKSDLNQSKLYIIKHMLLAYDTNLVQTRV